MWTLHYLPVLPGNCIKYNLLFVLTYQLVSPAHFIRIVIHLFHSRYCNPGSVQAAFPYCGWCSSNEERVCTTVSQCEAGRTWRSPYENCPPLARFRSEPEDVTVTLTESNPVVEVDLLCESEGGATPSWSRLRYTDLLILSNRYCLG